MDLFSISKRISHYRNSTPPPPIIPFLWSEKIASQKTELFAFSPLFTFAVALSKKLAMLRRSVGEKRHLCTCFERRNEGITRNPVAMGDGLDRGVC